MAQNFYCILTAVGEAKDANAKALGIPLRFKQMAVGDGGGVVPTPDRSRTKLYNQQYKALLNQLSRDPINTNQLIAELVIPEKEGGWWMRELGLYDEDGDLIAYGNCPPTYKPQLAEGSGRTQVVRMVIIMTSASNVELKIDPSVVLATRSYLESYAAQKAHTHNPADVIPGGLVGQVLRKKTNTSGDVEWVDLTDGVRINVSTAEESTTLAAEQTIVDLMKVTTNGIVVFIGGARLDKDIDYTIASINRLILAKPYPKGTRITVAQNETAGTVINPLDASKNLQDVTNADTARKNIGAATALTGTALMWPTLDCPVWALVRDGSAYPRATYPGLFNILAPVRTGTITQNAAGAIVSGLSRTTDLWVGMPYEHDTVPAGTTIRSIDSANQITLSANATASTADAAGRFFLHGYGNGGGATTFGLMDDRGLFERATDGSRGYDQSILLMTLAAGSKAVTGIGTTKGLYVGQSLTAPGIPAGATVASITSATSITLSVAATAGGAVNATITGRQVGSEEGQSVESHNHGNGAASWVFGGGGAVYDYASGGNVSRASPLLSYGGIETRPKNRAYLPIIVY
ncbi:phage tail protein [Herbaspirillum rubrisubalbicans Os34]|uniref:Phage tail protein n=1 Tax=Herbaspirillum rubrisubalbicans Os34 TaxID=1235827 RepID=A0A6M3ZNV7_9BURK|nr:phage tail protein [Herbaspirillum rubrisubalbicans]QJQ00206.1 phage tail protein [Herbaspirillum rubrisubalbicans Os34]